MALSASTSFRQCDVQGSALVQRLRIPPCNCRSCRQRSERVVEVTVSSRHFDGRSRPRRLSDHAGRNASERRAGLETSRCRNGPASTTFGATRRRGDFQHSSHTRIHAQWRAELESARGRVPYLARYEFSPLTVVRTATQARYSTRFRVAYGDCRSRAYSPRHTSPAQPELRCTDRPQCFRTDPSCGAEMALLRPTFTASSLMSFVPILPPPCTALAPFCSGERYRSAITLRLHPSAA